MELNKLKPVTAGLTNLRLAAALTRLTGEKPDITPLLDSVRNTGFLVKSYYFEGCCEERVFYVVDGKIWFVDLNGLFRKATVMTDILVMLCEFDDVSCTELASILGYNYIDVYQYLNKTLRRQGLAKLDTGGLCCLTAAGKRLAELLHVNERVTSCGSHVTVRQPLVL